MSKKQPVIRTCPKCGGAAHETTPQGLANLRGNGTYFTCTVCGLMTNQDGKAVVTNVNDIKQINSIAAGSRKAAESVPEFDQMSKASQALFQAKLAELALQMWMDGYKHGVLCHAVSEAYEARSAKQGG